MVGTIFRAKPSQITPVGRLRIKAEEIAASCGVSIESIGVYGKTAKVAEARRLLARYLRAKGCSYPQIAILIGRDHSSVMNLVEPWRYAEKKKRASKRYQERQRALKNSSQTCKPSESKENSQPAT